ncbi:MAG: hypothetical protein O9302_15890 [Cyclobacteriaceae bacterium]|jgi:hypothetical protein|nr:hypothetical protein [Cytophagales bacterium]MCZ8329546.1 hypothetical protein [Cyclobacteriaceae bacterium]
MKRKLFAFFLSVVLLVSGTTVFARNNIQQQNLGVDCTINVKIELENGTVIQGKVTFVNIGFFECVGIKIANTWNNIF